MKSRSGSMLVVALWAVLLLGIFSISLSLGVRQKAALLHRLSTLDAIYPIAYSGVEHARALITMDTDKDVDSMAESWAAPAEVRIGAGLVRFPSGIVDEQRKVNVNKTSPEILIRLLKNVSGLPENQAEETAYCMLDWMDSDEFFGHAQYGAEDRYYEGLPKPYEAKDAPFEVIDELLLVKGVTREIFDRIRPFVTVYGTGQVNVNTAPEEVLDALGLSKDMVRTVTALRQEQPFVSASEILTRVRAMTGQEVDASQQAVIEGLIASDRLGVRSEHFSVVSHAVLEASGVEADVEAVIDHQSRVLYQRTGRVQWPQRA